MYGIGSSRVSVAMHRLYIASLRVSFFVLCSPLSAWNPSTHVYVRPLFGPPCGHGQRCSSSKSRLGNKREVLRIWICLLERYCRFRTVPTTTETHNVNILTALLVLVSQKKINAKKRGGWKLQHINGCSPTTRASECGRARHAGEEKEQTPHVCALGISYVLCV